MCAISSKWLLVIKLHWKYLPFVCAIVGLRVVGRLWVLDLVVWIFCPFLSAGNLVDVFLATFRLCWVFWILFPLSPLQKCNPTHTPLLPLLLPNCRPLFKLCSSHRAGPGPLSLSEWQGSVNYFSHQPAQAASSSSHHWPPISTELIIKKFWLFHCNW